METMVNEEKTCPKCDKTYSVRPAISRIDNQTAICPLCGTREALESLGICEDEIGKILTTIASYEAK